LLDESCKMEDNVWDHITLPNDELDFKMWGSEGVPPEIDTTSVVESNDETKEAVWKKRSGLGQFSIQNSWERRMLVLAGNELRYHAIHEGHFNEDNPRGVFDLINDKVTFEVAGNTKDDDPTPFELTLKVNKNIWRICFDNDAALQKWIQVLSRKVKESESELREHEFEAGEHIIRWEILALPPVGYPIQIHGIVLEAGKNCVIIADFGMTSYGQKEGNTTTIPDANLEDHHNEGYLPESVMAAWEKVRPKEKQRLNVLALTDPYEIKKWSKVKYDSKSFSQAMNFTSWFNKPQHKKSEFDLKTYHVDWEQREDHINDTQKGQTEKHGDLHTQHHISKKPCSISNEPQWFLENLTQVYKDAAPSPSPSVFSLDQFEHDEAKEPNPTPLPPKVHPSHSDLPKSDPAKIVLARTNFLLEFGEAVLPPYHVFYSNSECIAVWCKTGRWSTLQTSVFLHATAIGNAKSATAVTIGVAAAHAILIPVIAVGGLAFATAPWFILKKSKERWDEATIDLTEKFWNWASPEVFVAAIENWSMLAEI